MTTYEIPDEPDVRDIWGPTPDGEGWVHYERFNTSHRLVGNWREVGNPHAGTYTWLELIVRGPLHDENPDPPLEVLRDRVVEAAQRWTNGIQAREGKPTLLEAVRAYEKKQKGTA